MSYKQNRIITIQNKIENTQALQYNINGIDLTLAKFFYRTPQHEFIIMAPGDYKITTSSNNTFLVITNQTIIDTAESFQIGYEYNLTSSPYNPIGDIDINTLNAKYNELQADSQALFEYVRKTLMVADDAEGMSVVLPQLDEGEVWVKTATGYQGFQVGALEAQIQELLRQINEATTNALQDIGNLKDNAVSTITLTGNGQNTRVKLQGNTQVNRLNSIDSQISQKLELMQRMSIVVNGANKYLDGSYLYNRDVSQLERFADGQKLSDRVGPPRRKYDGGKLSERIVDVGLHIDLGEVQ